MSYPESRQRIENILVELKRDILVLSIKKHNLSDNALHMIETLDSHLPKMVEDVREMYKSGIDLNRAIDFYKYLRTILEETLGIARLDQVIKNDENEMVAHVKNQFVQVTREVKYAIENGHQ